MGKLRQFDAAMWEDELERYAGHVESSSARSNLEDGQAGANSILPFRSGAVSGPLKNVDHASADDDELLHHQDPSPIDCEDCCTTYL